MNWDKNDANDISGNYQNETSLLGNCDSSSWKVGDRCLAQFSNDEGWYPCCITILMEDEVTVTFEHNLEIKNIPVKNLKKLSSYDQYTLITSVSTEYDTVLDHPEVKEVGDITFDNVEQQFDEGDNSTAEDDKEDKVEEDEDIEDDRGAQENDNDMNEEQREEDDEMVEGEFKTGIEDFWKEGDVCVALWDEDGRWYKAVIDGIEGDTAVVTFTEYGNSAYCQVDNIVDSNRLIDSDGQLVPEEVADEWN